MSNNMNSGYSGWSMSNRAAAAYDDGEMPKSKWTKKSIVAALEAYCDENDLLFVEPRGTKAELFERFVELKSWHHTSKLCNATDFYGLDEEAADEAFAPMTAEQAAERDAARKAAREQAEAERKALAERMKAKESYGKTFREERGYEFGSVAHYAAEHPEMVQFSTSRKGAEIAVVLHDGKSTVYEAKRIATASAWWFDPEMAL